MLRRCFCSRRVKSCCDYTCEHKKIDGTGRLNIQRQDSQNAYTLGVNGLNGVENSTRWS